MGVGGRAMLVAPMLGELARAVCNAGDEAATNQGLPTIEA